MYLIPPPYLPAGLEQASRTRLAGFTLLELMAVTTIIAVLAALAIPNFREVLERARNTQAIGDMEALDTDLQVYAIENMTYPEDLSAIGADGLTDPWGNPYQYLRLAGEEKSVRGQARKDRFLVPINSDFDLYSKGADGQTTAALTAANSQDDIIRANDGGYVGLAKNY